MEQLEKINRLLESLFAPQTLDKKLKIITDGIVEIFQADFCRIWMIKPGDLCDSGCIHAKVTKGPHICHFRDRCLHLVASSGRYTHTDGKIHRRVPFACYKIGRVASGQNAKFLTNDVAHDPQIHNHDWARELGLVSFAGYRMLAPSGKPTGVLALFSKHPIGTEKDNLLESMANIASQVILEGKAEERLLARQKEIESLNLNLERRVREEVQKSRDKDAVMIKQSRLAAMGEMIGNIAHQWRQPLNALNILLYNIMEFCENKNLDDKEFDSLIAKGNSLIEKMSMTIDDFRKFFKPDKEKRKFSINQTIKYSLSLFNASFKYHHISAEVVENKELFSIGFPNEYSQVILNILSNAKDSIVAKRISGKLKIEILQKESTAIVKIEDNGGGISENIMDRIFDPYYTTKDEGEGVGIGLYMSKMIIEKHMNGHITAQNSGVGAEFEIITPMIN